MRRTWLLPIALLLTGGAASAEQATPKLELKPVSKAPARSADFFTSFLAPRMAARLARDRALTMDDVSRVNPNPWMRDVDATERVEKEAIRATKSALKHYAMEKLNVEAWSLPLVKSQGRGLAALRTDSGGARLRFGFSHLAPRAEVLVPLATGRFGFSADALGRIGTSFETTRKAIQVGASVDPREKSASIGLRFGF